MSFYYLRVEGKVGEGAVKIRFRTHPKERLRDKSVVIPAKIYSEIIMGEPDKKGIVRYDPDKFTELYSALYSKEANEARAKAERKRLGRQTVEDIAEGVLLSSDDRDSSQDIDPNLVFNNEKNTDGTIPLA